MICAASRSNSLLVSAGPSRCVARGVSLKPWVAADGSQHRLLRNFNLEQTVGGSHPAWRSGRLLPRRQQGPVISLELPAVLCSAEQSAGSHLAVPELGVLALLC